MKDIDIQDLLNGVQIHSGLKTYPELYRSKVIKLELNQLVKLLDEYYPDEYDLQLTIQSQQSKPTTTKDISIGNKSFSIMPSDFEASSISSRVTVKKKYLTPVDKETYQVILHFPEVMLVASEGQDKRLLKDMFVKLVINLEGLFTTGSSISMVGCRSTVSQDEYDSSFVHSHLCKTQNFWQWSSFCWGTSMAEIVQNIVKDTKGRLELNAMESALVTLPEYVAYEHTGHGYCHIKDIKRSTNTNKPDTVIDAEILRLKEIIKKDLFSSIHLNTIESSLGRIPMVDTNNLEEVILPHCKWTVSISQDGQTKYHNKVEIKKETGYTTVQKNVVKLGDKTFDAVILSKTEDKESTEISITEHVSPKILEKLIPYVNNLVFNTITVPYLI